jgi:CheY-like chemotaxis protein
MPRILIVDDEVDLADVLAMDFEIEGFESSRATSVDEALNQIHQRAPDLILSDVRMPNKSGFDLLQAVRTDLKSQMSFMLMSGFSDLGSDDAFASGADAFVAKPYDRDTLLTMARRLLLPLGAARIKKGLFPIPAKNLIRGSDGLLGQAELGLQGFFAPLGGDEKLRLVPNIAVEFEVTHKNALLRGNGIVRWRRHQTQEKLPPGLGIEIWDLEDRSIPTFESLLQGMGPARIPKSASFV